MLRLFLSKYSKQSDTDTDMADTAIQFADTNIYNIYWYQPKISANRLIGPTIG